MIYRPLPTLEPRAQDEDQPTYGLRTLRFILECRSVLATLSDRDLELADDAARDYATQATGPKGRTDRLEPHQLRLIQQFSDARHWIAASQQRRRRWAQEDAQQAQDATHPQGGKQPGRPAPLAPQPPGKGPGSHADSRPQAPDFLDSLRAQVQQRQPQDDGIRF